MGPVSGGLQGDNSQASPDGIDVEPIAELVERLVATMQRGGVARLDVSYGDLRVSLRSGATSARSGGTSEARSIEPAQIAEFFEDDDELHVVASPMIGTFYAASAPNEPPFVTPGEIVEAGQTIGIVEAMKIMNEIAADRGGEVIDVVAVNGQTVEYGSPLIRLRPLD
jgi:acetyl-CoA carboxylase biotin carboxyl carrier protein